MGFRYKKKVYHLNFKKMARCKQKCRLARCRHNTKKGLRCCLCVGPKGDADRQLCARHKGQVPKGPVPKGPVPKGPPSLTNRFGSRKKRTKPCVDTFLLDAAEVKRRQYIYATPPGKKIVDDVPWKVENFGICNDLGDLSVTRAIASGTFNSVRVVEAKRLPWSTVDCAIQLKNSTAGSQKLIHRQLKKPDIAYSLLHEISLASFLSDKKVAPQIYGARLIQEKPKPNHTMKYSVMHMIMDAFNGTLADMYKNITVTKTIEDSVSRQLASHILTLSKMNVMCIDLKPGNAVYRLHEDGSVNIRLIDFGIDLCGVDFTMDEINHYRTLEEQIHERKLRFADRAGGAYDSDRVRRMREGLMVLVLRCTIMLHIDVGDTLSDAEYLKKFDSKREVPYNVYIMPHYPEITQIRLAQLQYSTSPILKEKLKSMYDAKRQLLNGVPIRDYDKWLRNGVLHVRGGLVHYLKGDQVFYSHSVINGVSRVRQIIEVALY